MMRVTVVRAGAVARIAGAELTPSTPVLALVFADVRFPDGRMERWVGPGQPSDASAQARNLADLQAWALAVARQQFGSLAEEIAESFELDSALPEPTDVYVEWNVDFPQELVDRYRS